MLNKKRGVSLIILVITILVMFILLGVSISFLTKENPIGVSKKTVFLNNINVMQERLDEAMAKKENEDPNFQREDLYVIDCTNFSEYFPKVPKKYLSKVLIEGGVVSLKKEALDVKELEYVNSENIKLKPKYYKPIIPAGYTHVSGTWNNAYTIEDKSQNQYVWIPCMMLNGQYVNGCQTVENKNPNKLDYNKEFGLRDFSDEIYLKTYLKNKSNQKEEVFITDYYSNYSGNENLNEYKEIIDSVEKYGGFYISKYEIGGNFESKPGKNVLSVDSVTLPRDSGNVIRMIPTASHYDTLFTYLIATGKKSYNDIYKNSESFGVYKDGVSLTGQKNVDGIYDLAGNAWEASQGKLINAKDEVIGTGLEIRRGGYKGNVNKGSMGDIFYKTETTLPTEKGGFRFVLHIK